MRIALILDRPQNSKNKNANTLYLGDYEMCTAGDVSSRLYVENDTGDIIEVEDNTTNILEDMKRKIVEVKEVMTLDNFKPKILFMVRNGDGGKTNYNPTSIRKLYDKFKDEMNKGNLQPYTLQVSDEKLDYKLYPTFIDQCVFGIVESSNLENMYQIVIRLTNKILKEVNYLMTQTGVIIEKYVTTIADGNKLMVESICRLDDLYLKTLGLLQKSAGLEDKYDQLIASICLHTKVYTITNFVNATSNRFSELVFSAKNNKDTDKEPFVDIVIVALSGSTYVAMASFRVDKYTRKLSGFYTTNNQIIHGSRLTGDNYASIICRNRYTYKIITSWDMNIHVSVNQYKGWFPGSNEFNKQVTWNLIKNTEFVASNGRRYRLDMITDQYGGRLLQTIDAETGAVQSQPRSELTSPKGRCIKIVKGSIVGYFGMSTSRTVSGLQPSVVDSSGRRYYLTHTDAIIITQANKEYICEATVHTSGASWCVSPMTPFISKNKIGVFEGYIKLDYYFKLLGGNLDSHGCEIWVYNKNDRSKYVYIKGGKDAGSSYGQEQLGWESYTLSKAQVNKITGGEKNVELEFRLRSGADRAKHSVSMVTKLYVTTR